MLPLPTEAGCANEQGEAEVTPPEREDYDPGITHAYRGDGREFTTEDAALALLELRYRSFNRHVSLATGEGTRSGPAADPQDSTKRSSRDISPEKGGGSREVYEGSSGAGPSGAADAGNGGP